MDTTMQPYLDLGTREPESLLCDLRIFLILNAPNSHELTAGHVGTWRELATDLLDWNDLTLWLGELSFIPSSKLLLYIISVYC